MSNTREAPETQSKSDVKESCRHKTQDSSQTRSNADSSGGHASQSAYCWSSSTCRDPVSGGEKDKRFVNRGIFCSEYKTGDRIRHVFVKCDGKDGEYVVVWKTCPYL